MIFHRYQSVLYALLSLTLAGCMSNSSTGAGAGPAPLQKAQRASFVTYLNESSEVLELSTVAINPGTTSPAPGSTPGTTKPLVDRLGLPLIHLATQMARPTDAAAQGLRALLNQELSTGKCKFGVTGAPPANLPPGQPVTMQTSLSGPACSFESAATIKVVTSQGSDVAQNHVISDMKIGFALKSAQLLATYDVSKVDLQVSAEIKTDPKKAMIVNMTMATAQQSKIHGAVTTSISLNSALPVDQKTQPTVALTCRFQSKDWNVVFVANANPGTEPVATLNGEKLTEADQDLLVAITKSFSMFQPSASTGSIAGGPKR